MCGILGYSAPIQSAESYHDSLKLGILKLGHRGPDHSDYWVNTNKTLGIGHTRLSIIDINPRANQPMLEMGQALVISFNGEIYNFLELRQELESNGYKFDTNSDTEVILKGYAHWEKEVFKKIRGMFAIAIFDQTKKEIILARDHSGQKPLFYYFDQEKKVFIFASELKAFFSFKHFTNKISPTSLYRLFLKGFCEDDLAIYQKIKKLNAGNYLCLDLQKFYLNTKVFWPIEDIVRQTKRSFLSIDKVFEELEKLLFESIELQLRSDVPVGLLLSGGVDSSLIVALASRIQNDLNTYTVRFPGYEKFDESNHARLIAEKFGTNHTEIEASSINPNIIDELVYFFDEPIFDTSVLPTYLLAKEISKHCKVAIGGDGGDELFGGYPHYDKLLRMKNFSTNIPFFLRALISKLIQSNLPIGLKGKKTMEFFGTDLTSNYPNTSEFFSINEQSKVFKLNFLEYINFKKSEEVEPIIFENLVDTATYYDFQRFLREDILVKVDRASMANSLEVRSPFLDHKLIEFAFTNISPSLKVTNDHRKIILKKFAERHLPESFDFKRKQGFSLPLRELILTPSWQEYFETKINNSDPNIFNHEYAHSLLKKQSSYYNNAERMAGLVFFMAWVEKFNPLFDFTK